MPLFRKTDWTRIPRPLTNFRITQVVMLLSNVKRCEDSLRVFFVFSIYWRCFLDLRGSNPGETLLLYNKYHILLSFSFYFAIILEQRLHLTSPCSFPIYITKTFQWPIVIHSNLRQKRINISHLCTSEIIFHTVNNKIFTWSNVITRFLKLS